MALRTLRDHHMEHSLQSNIVRIVLDSDNEASILSAGRGASSRARVSVLREISTDELLDDEATSSLRHWGE